MARFISRCTGFEVIVNEDALADGLQNIDLPVRFGRGVPPQQLLKILGITASPITQQSSMLWIRSLLSRRPQADLYELSFPMSGSHRKVRELMEELQDHEPSLLPESERQKALPNDLKAYVLRTLALTVITLPILALEWGRVLPNRPLTSRAIQLALASVTQILGWPLFSTAIRVLWYLHAIDLGLLATISVNLAYCFSVVAFTFEAASRGFAEPFFETSALLITLIFAGKTIQVATRRAVGSAIDKLRNLQAKEVDLVTQREDSAVIQRVDARLVQVGDIVRILPDTQVPVDGLVVSGTSAIDESSISGESVPAGKSPGSTVLAGTYNIQGTLEVQVTRMTQDNSLAAVANLVQLAQASRTSLQDTADLLASRILPIALVISVISFFVWLFVTHYRRGEPWGYSVGEAMTYAIAVMAASCPCALALAVSLVIARRSVDPLLKLYFPRLFLQIPFPATAAIIAGAREGVLFRQIDALSQASKAQIFAFDKTGTLSQGRLTVTFAKYEQVGAASLIRQLAGASRHPVSLAVSAYTLEQNIATVESALQASQIESIPGAGVTAVVEIGGVPFKLKAGSPAFTHCEASEDVKACLDEGLSMYVMTLEGSIIAIFGLKDNAREESPELIAGLQKAGKEVALISGDGISAVTSFAKEVGIPASHTFAQRKPAQKAETITALKSSAASPKVLCFVGDGANDSVALSSADVSVSVASGADIALAASGIVLRGADLHRDLNAVLAISRLYHWASLAALGWCIIYFSFAMLLASGAAVKFRLTPQFAAFSEIISVVPVLATGAILYLIRKLQLYRQA